MGIKNKILRTAVPHKCQDVGKKSQEITEHEIKRLYDMLEPFKTRRQKMKLKVEELEFEIDRKIAKDEIYK